MCLLFDMETKINAPLRIIEDARDYSSHFHFGGLVKTQDNASRIIETRLFLISSHVNHHSGAYTAVFLLLVVIIVKLFSLFQG